MTTFPPIDKISEDPDRVEELIDVVGATADRAQNRHAGRSIELIRKLESQVSNGHVFGDIVNLRATLAGIERPCIAIRNDGRIVTQNFAAETLIGMNTVVSTLDESDLIPIEGNRWTDILAGDRSNEPKPRRQRFLKAHLTSSDTDFFVVLVPTRMQLNRDVLTLVVLVDTLWDDTLKTICLQNYGLTQGELNVVEKFVNGQDLREIADATGRSIATIRKHFYTVLEKFEVSSQTDLLRELFSFSNLLEISKPIADRYQAPRRSRENLLRRDGRTLEMYISGDRQGTLLLSLSDSSHLIFRPEAEDMLYEMGLCVLVVVRPGFGTTSPPADGVSYEDCLAEDVASVLDQLGVAQAPLFAPHVSFVSALAISQIIPQRITKIISTLVLPPTPYLTRKKSSGAIARLAFNIVNGNRTAAELAIRVAADALSILGARKVFSILLDNKRKKDAYSSPDMTMLLDTSIKSVVAQGSKAVAVDYMRGFSDWSDLIEDCPVPLDIIREEVSLFMDDDVFDRFLADFDHKIACTPREDGDELCDILQHLIRPVQENP